MKPSDKMTEADDRFYSDQTDIDNVLDEFGDMWEACGDRIAFMAAVRLSAVKHKRQETNDETK